MLDKTRPLDVYCPSPVMAFHQSTPYVGAQYYRNLRVYSDSVLQCPSYKLFYWTVLSLECYQVLC